MSVKAKTSGGQSMSSREKGIPDAVSQVDAMVGGLAVAISRGLLACGVRDAADPISLALMMSSPKERASGGSSVPARIEAGSLPAHSPMGEGVSPPLTTSRSIRGRSPAFTVQVWRSR